MKVDLSKEEYRVGEIFSLAGMVLDGYGRGNVPEKKPFYELEQKIYASCDDFGSGDGYAGIPTATNLRENGMRKPPKKWCVFMTSSSTMRFGKN